MDSRLRGNDEKGGGGAMPLPHAGGAARLMREAH